MKKITAAFIAVLAITGTMILFTQNNAMSDEQKKPAPAPEMAEGHQQITLGAGCFWCVEAIYNRLDGVVSATSGYMGGTNPNPTYEDVIHRNTGEVEVVHVIYDPAKISTETILAWFWKAHDPTQVDGQGADRGPQYLSTIFCQDEKQTQIAMASKAEAQKEFEKPIATKIKMAKKFYPAEIYHQNYYRLNKSNPYCQAVVAPKMEKLKLDDKPDLAK
jgi:peptide-methionine (S)-S-oxide reductase